MNPLFVGFIKAGLAIAVNTVVSSLMEGQQRGGQRQIQQQDGVFISHDAYREALRNKQELDDIDILVKHFHF